MKHAFTPHAFARCVAMLLAAASPALTPALTLAQATAPTPAASAPAVKPHAEPTPTQRGAENATPMSGDPARAPVPQIRVPLGKDPSASEPLPRPSQPARAASAGVDDAVARCEAERDKHVRAACRARLARQGHAER